MTETKAPEGDGCYYKEMGTVYFDITYNGNGKTEGGLTITGPYAANGGTTVKLGGNIEKSVTEVASGIATNYNLQVTLRNIPFIKLSGQVWVDEQEGDKDATNPNGLKDEETYVQGVKVYLHSNKDNAEIREDVTDSNGRYEFDDIEKTEEGYNIHFEYNGIAYNDLGITPDKDGKCGSDAAENDTERDSFNGRFKTITEVGANGGSPFDYTYSDTEAKLNAKTDGSKPVDSSIKAYTNASYTRSTENIDCGLIEKYFDLSVENNIEKVTYKINNMEWEDVPENKKVEYTSSMEYSDYAYRFDHYEKNKLKVYENALGGETEKEVDAFQTELADDMNRKDEVVGGQNTELDVEVTYDLQIHNNGLHDASEVKVKYTYNNIYYELISIDGIEQSASGEIEIIRSVEKSKTTPVEFVFKLRKQDRNLPTEILSEAGLTVITNAEIISYSSSEGGLVDDDSQPGNGRTEEDDYSDFNLTFNIKEYDREISGNVAEANTNDGSLENKPIDNVVVQLIEIVPTEDGRLCEYIWQETVSGSNKVKIRRDDKTVSVYDNGLSGNYKGQYSFSGGYAVEAKDSIGNTRSFTKGIIPGNYIIRFIYGDGKTLYLDSDGKMKNLTDMTYNGQDYKSTVDASYTEEFYNPNNYNGKSTARDNEARRLEVMAFSAEIDGKLGTALKTLNLEKYEDITNTKEQSLLKEYFQYIKENDEEGVEFVYKASNGNPYSEEEMPATLSDEEIFKTVKYYASWKTWMAAETSKIKVTNKIMEETVNFGLKQRPQTKLEIEKHITALKITPTGTGVQPIIDAKLDNFSDVIEDPSKELDVTGITTGLAPILSTRNNRGFWYVATDVEELIQGAKLEVEYTYVIRNLSETDYLSKFLVSEFGKEDYKTTLMDKAQEIKTNRKKGDPISGESFLGSYYYTGEYKETEVDLVPSIVDTLEEAINNKLRFEENSNNTAFKIKETKTYKNILDVNGAPTTENIETIVETITASNSLTEGSKDFTKTIKLTTTLSTAEGGEIGADIPSYIAEITKYSNAAGRENVVVPSNLTYVHSEDSRITMESDNEIDEFWGETIIISKPTGEDKNIAMIITITAISGIAVIGVGIILIKKYVIKK